MDQRDTMLDQLSQLVPITVASNKDGSDQVNIGGIQIINGTDDEVARRSAPGSRYTVTTSTGDALPSLGGQIGAMLTVANSATCPRRSRASTRSRRRSSPT